MGTTSDTAFSVIHAIFSVAEVVFFVIVPVIIIGVFLLIARITKATEAFKTSPEFLNMKAEQKDIPQDAVCLPCENLRGDKPVGAIYIAGPEAFLPLSLIANQCGTAMRDLGMQTLRLSLRDVSEVTRLTISGPRGGVSYLLFTVPGLPKTVAIYSGKGLGDPPPELFDTGKFLQLASRHLSLPVKDLGPQRFWQVLKYM